ncbi:MAG TPA: hypothetical protein VGD71_31545, partial [Kribbella sp.]
MRRLFAAAVGRVPLPVRGDTARVPIGLSDPDGVQYGQGSDLNIAMRRAVVNALDFLRNDLELTTNPAGAGFTCMPGPDSRSTPASTSSATRPPPRWRTPAPHCESAGCPLHAGPSAVGALRLPALAAAGADDHHRPEDHQTGTQHQGHEDNRAGERQAVVLV